MFRSVRAQVFLAVFLSGSILFQSLQASIDSIRDHYLIVTDAPGFDANQLLLYGKRAVVVALDGAADKIGAVGLKLDVILGDFDSVADREKWGIEACEGAPYQGKNGVMIVPAPNQDLSDLEKGILYCDAQGAQSVVVLNAVGGRMDHTLGNIRFLRKYYDPDRKLLIATDQ